MKIKEWWQNLNQREQFIVAVGSLFAIIILFYLFIWSPLTSSLINKKSHVRYQQTLLQWMQDAQKQLQQLKSQETLAAKINTADLLTTVDESLKTKNLAAFTSSIAQSADQSVLVKFKQMPFNALLQWCDFLWKRYGVIVAQISVNKDNKISGVVNGEVTFKVQ